MPLSDIIDVTPTKYYKNRNKTVKTYKVSINVARKDINDTLFKQLKNLAGYDNLTFFTNNFNPVWTFNKKSEAKRAQSRLRAFIKERTVELEVVKGKKVLTFTTRASGTFTIIGNYCDF